MSRRRRRKSSPWSCLGLPFHPGLAGLVPVHFPVCFVKRLCRRPRPVDPAEADGQLDVRIPLDFGRAHGGADLLDPVIERLLRDLREQQQELVAAVADEDVRRADTRRERLCDRAPVSASKLAASSLACGRSSSSREPSTSIQRPSAMHETISSTQGSPSISTYWAITKYTSPSANSSLLRRSLCSIACMEMQLSQRVL